MARTSTTHDVFSAIGEPRRRALINRLAGGDEMTVSFVAPPNEPPEPKVSRPAVCGAERKPQKKHSWRAPKKETTRFLQLLNKWTRSAKRRPNTAKRSKPK